MARKLPLKFITTTSEDVTVRRVPNEPGYRIVVPRIKFRSAPRENKKELVAYCRGLLKFKRHGDNLVGWVPLRGVPRADGHALTKKVLVCFIAGQVHLIREDRHKRKRA